MNRRKFITLLGGAAGWSLAGRAQQRSMPVIGFLGLASDPDPSTFPAGRAFLAGLAQAGYAPGRNLAIEVRGVNFQNSILPRVTADLVARKVAVIVTSGSPYVAVAVNPGPASDRNRWPASNWNAWPASSESASRRGCSNTIANSPGRHARE
jgi:putative ABC transport system substrate-binding protein